jgi:hypothetical protein
MKPDWFIYIYIYIYTKHHRFNFLLSNIYNMKIKNLHSLICRAISWWKRHRGLVDGCVGSVGRVCWAVVWRGGQILWWWWRSSFNWCGYGCGCGLRAFVVKISAHLQRKDFEGKEWEKIREKMKWWVCYVCRGGGRLERLRKWCTLVKQGS